MWDLPRPGLEPASPALAGSLSTTAPPGKPWSCFIDRILPFTGGYRLEGYGEKIQSGGERRKLGHIQVGGDASWEGYRLG